MQEFFPVEGMNFTRITDRPRQIMKEQGNVEAFEILELSNEVQCQHCHTYMSSGHVHRSCGLSLVHTIPKPVIVAQIQSNIRQKFELLTTPAFFVIRGPTRRRKWCLSQDPQEGGKAH